MLFWFTQLLFMSLLNEIWCNQNEIINHNDPSRKRLILMRLTISITVTFTSESHIIFKCNRIDCSSFINQFTFFITGLEVDSKC